LAYLPQFDKIDFGYIGHRLFAARGRSVQRRRIAQAAVHLMGAGTTDRDTP
jgi:hypothetical protein